MSDKIYRCQHEETFAILWLPYKPVGPYDCVEFVRASDYDRDIQVAIAAGQRMQFERDTLRTAKQRLDGEVARLKAEVEKLNAAPKLYEAVERACGELPEGWAINVCMENGAGWIELFDDDGVQIEDFPTNNERLDYTLNDAIDAALRGNGGDA